MKRIARRLGIALILSFAVGLTQAQTICPGPIAQIISPTQGSTLPAGAVTFAWCHANGDYFLDIESVPGAHNIFFGFLTVESVTLGPTCNIPNPISPTTQCIPANGETIYVTLWTNTAQSGRRHYVAAPTLTFTAANSDQTPVPVATTITVGNQTVPFSSSAQSVTLTAAVAAASTVNQGNVTFQVLDGAANIGAAVTSATLTTGSASVIDVLPAGTAPKNYTIQATYSGGPNFEPSSGIGTLTVSPAPPTAAPTATTVGDKTVTFSSDIQHVALTATVAAPGGIVDQGTVTFQVLDGTTNLGTAVPSAALTNGSASVIYTLPAGLAARDYSIHAAYSGGNDFQPSSGTGTLTITNVGFSLGFDSPTINATRGTKVKVTVHINRTGGFTGNVTVTPPDVSGEGIIVKFPDPIQTGDPSATWKLKIKMSTPAGPHLLTFTGTDGSGMVHTAAVTLTVD